MIFILLCGTFCEGYLRLVAVIGRCVTCVIWLVALDRTLVSSVTSQLLLSVSNEIALKALIFGETSIQLAQGTGFCQI